MKRQTENKARKTLKQPFKLENLFSPINLILLAIGFLLLFFLYRFTTSEQKLFSVNFIPILMGVVFETKRYGISWKEIFFKVGASLIGSLILLILCGKMNVEEILNSWELAFILVYVVMSVFMFQKEVTTKLTEGVTLLQSLCILYWIKDCGLFEQNDAFPLFIIFLSIVFLLYSIYHGLIKSSLTDESRLKLSIGSSIIMIVFAVDNISRVSDIPELETLSIKLASSAFIQFFLLGVSAMYMMQNFFMLYTYLPDKQHFYGREHMKKIKERNKEHLERYSKEEVTTFDSILCITFCLTLFWINNQKLLLPRNTIIWVAILTFPFFINIKNKIVR